MNELIFIIGYFGLICSLCGINNDINDYRKTHNPDMLPVIYAECTMLVAWIAYIVVAIVKDGV